MRITTRTKAIAFFITLGACLVALAVALNVSWILFHWRQVVPLVFGIIFFGVIIAGMVINTIFLVREIRRNERQDSFLNAVTHELKTPIASIRLYLETLQSRNLDEKQRASFYRIMLEDTDRLLGTVEQVLKAGETKHGSDRSTWTEVNFSKIVLETVELARIRKNIGKDALRFSSEPQEEMLVLGNADELRTAVFNLLDNAVKYSADNPRITVSLLRPNIDSVVLQVNDEGVGIARDELKRIFKRFYRAQNRLSGEVKGTGLGLFIVRSIARRHGGEAHAESAGELAGSTFTLRLPRVHRS
ncbi:MAG TPA: ATP-binding protein [Candidatus Eremiobacteraceae bacterium]|nr:ATP-binding protein [Candidatus Eremiobacteraceae bacterium]